MTIKDILEDSIDNPETWDYLARILVQNLSLKFAAIESYNKGTLSRETYMKILRMTEENLQEIIDNIEFAKVV